MGHSFIPETCSTFPGAQMQGCGVGVSEEPPTPLKALSELVHTAAPKVWGCGLSG